MTFLSLGWLIYINLWHSSTHIRDQHHAESATDHHGGITARKVKCCGDNNSPRKTLPHHIEELARIYIYIYMLYYLYIYIYVCILHILCIWYISWLPWAKRGISQCRVKIPSGDAPCDDVEDLVKTTIEMWTIWGSSNLKTGQGCQ